MPSSPKSNITRHRTVLLAVTGISPAVLTETVWALSREKPPVVPDEVVVITTSRGAAELQAELLQSRPAHCGNSIWQALRGTILGRTKARTDRRLLLRDPVVIAAPDPASGSLRPLDDIRTASDNEAAAETILAEVRRIATDPDTRLVASLAGGRKTMGALLHAALSLAGRPGDHLTHVLVNAPFDDPRLTPRFYFPGQPGSTRFTLTTADGTRQSVTASTAHIHLAAVPVVALGEIVQNRCGRTPGTFAGLVRAADALVQDLDSPVEIELDADHALALLDGEPVKLTGLDRPFFAFLFDRAARAEQSLPDHSAAAEAFNPFLRTWVDRHREVNLEFSGTDWRRKTIEPDDIRKRLNSLRTRLREAGLTTHISTLLPRRGPVGFSPRHVRLKA